jgi:hypothetical protein
LNLRPPAPKAGALPSCATPRGRPSLGGSPRRPAPGGRSRSGDPAADGEVRVDLPRSGRSPAGLPRSPLPLVQRRAAQDATHGRPPEGVGRRAVPPVVQRVDERLRDREPVRQSPVARRAAARGGARADPGEERQEAPTERRAHRPTEPGAGSAPASRAVSGGEANPRPAARAIERRAAVRTRTRTTNIATMPAVLSAPEQRLESPPPADARAGNPGR